MTYQEWRSPSFDLGQLFDICKEFFREQNFPTTFQQKKSDKWVILVQVTPIAKVQTLTVEQKENKIRLAFLPVHHSEDGLTRLGGLFVSGRAYKVMTQNQIFLDGLESRFWENLDRKIAQLSPNDARRL